MYRLDHKLFRYHKVAAKCVDKWAKRSQILMNFQLFDFLTWFHNYFSYRIKGGMWHEWRTQRRHPVVFTCFIKRPAAALNAHIALGSMSHKRRKKGTVVSYYEAVIQLFKTYAIHSESLKWPAIWCPLHSLPKDRLRNVLKLLGIRRKNATEYMKNSSWKIPLLMDYWTSSATVWALTAVWRKTLKYRIWCYWRRCYLNCKLLQSIPTHHVIMERRKSNGKIMDAARATHLLSSLVRRLRLKITAK